jgi:hypothetical protein
VVGKLAAKGERPDARRSVTREVIAGPRAERIHDSTERIDARTAVTFTTEPTFHAQPHDQRETEPQREHSARE